MSLDGISVQLVESVDDAAAFMRWLSESRPVLGFDTETSGLHWWTEHCRLVQFADAMTGWAIPFERWSGVVAEVFAKYDGPIVGHNARFDVHFMAHHGITVPQAQLHDTMLAANALWPDERLALKSLAQRRIDSHAADGQAALDEAMGQHRWTWATVPVDLPAYWAYGALDAVLSARLYEHMEPLLHAAQVHEVYELECAVSQVLFKMETRGARIDVDFCRTKYAELIEYAENLREWCNDTYHVSPGSAAEVIPVLEAAGVTFTKRTAKGRKALDEDVLSHIEHPLAEAVLNVRRSEKIANTYFANFVSRACGDLLHCSVRQVGAKTGRMSITEPALQTLPRDNQVVRNAFIPSDGNKLVTADYKQIEMRLLAHFAGEDEMIKRIREGVDMHTAVAQAIYHTDDPTRAQRQITKNANFAKAYVAGAKKFAQTAGISEAEGVEFYAQYDATFPGVKRFQREVCDVAERRFRDEGRAYVRAPSGRLHVADESSIYKCVNYLIQGCAADVLKQKIVDLDLAGLGEYLVIPVHDEVIFDFPADEAEALSAEAAHIMEDHHTFAVPLEVDVSPPLDRWMKV